MKILAVIFDMDGVLVDSEHFLARCLNRAFREKFGLEVPPGEFLALAGTGSRCITEPAARRGVEVDLKTFREYLFPEVYVPDAPKNLKPFPGAVELFHKCREAGLKLAVASNGSPMKVAANLAALGLPEEEWDAVLTQADVKTPKPDPEIYLTAAARLGLRPEYCVVVEDSPTGIEAARAAGMFTVAVETSFAAESLYRAGADVVMPGLAEISLDDLGAPEK